MPYSMQSLYAYIDKCFDVRVSEDLIVNLFIIQSDAATMEYTNQVVWINFTLP